MTEATVPCPTCEGSGETPVQDCWSYGDSRGRGEGHYTTGGDKCPCCNGETVVPVDSGHAADDDCGQPSDPPEPDEDERERDRYRRAQAEAEDAAEEC